MAARQKLIRLGMTHTRMWVRACLGILALTTIFMLYSLISQSGQITAQAQRIDTTSAERAALAEDVSTLRGQVLSLGEQPVVNAPPAASRPGSDGRDGNDGADGADGVGIPGVTGASGAPGIDGLNGINGADGKAITGPTGLPGASGAPGLSVTGAPGASGANGTDGTNGTNGVDGAPGASGAAGRGIASTACVGDGDASFWQVTYTDGATENAGGPCEAVTPTDSGQSGPATPTQ